MNKRTLGVALVLVWLAWGAPSGMEQAPAQPVLQIDGLPDDRYLVGSVPLTARLEPEETPVDWVAFVVEGETRCHLTRKPFTCVLNLSPRAEGWRVAVTAALPNRAMITQTFTAVTVTSSTSVSRVLVPIVVRDRRGQPMRGLAREAFRVYDNDVLHTPDFCEAQQIRLDVVLAVDISYSMRRSLAELQGIFGSFITSLGGNAAVTLLAFNQQVFAVTQGESNPDVLRRSVDQLDAVGQSALYDAIFVGMDYLRPGSGQVPALVVFTDGEDEISRAGPTAIREKIRSVEGAVYLIVRETRLTTARMLQTLEVIAEESGGELMLMETIGDLREYLERIRQSLTTIYLCGFSPANPPDGTLHTLRVEVVGQPGTVVRARRTYFARAR